MPRQTAPFTAVHESIPHLEDFQLVQLAIDGDRRALDRLQPLFEAPLVKFLIFKGASEQEAEDISREMWADCLVAGEGESPRLARYDGGCRLSSWLNTVALNRLLTAKRKQARLNRIGIDSLHQSISDDQGSSTLETLIPDVRAEEPDQPLIALLKDALEAGFRECTPEQFVMMRLAYGDRLKFADLGRMWGCNPGTISRRLDESKKVVSRTVMQHIRRADPWLELEWADFSQLCKSATIGALGFD